MASTKEIKNRIKSIKDTQKITNAMYLISSTKMRKAKSELDQTRPYFEALQGEIKRIFRTAKDVESRYFYPPSGEKALNGTCGCLVITADKGLAGAYNQNVIREVTKFLQGRRDTRLYVVGDYGRQFFARHQIPIERSFLYTAQNPTMQRAREIGDHLLDLYDLGELDTIYIVYTDFQNGLYSEVRTTRLVPSHRPQLVSDPRQQADSEQFEFQPSVVSVLNNVMRSYITGFIYSALVDSFCSEQNARMTAMNAANENAEKMLGDLSVQYNRVRQAAITAEITEVSAGAKALKRNREKEAPQL